MSSSPSPPHLNNRHRNTLVQIFQHPVSHNIEWRSVRSLLEVVASVEDRQDGNVVVTLGPETETFEPPRHKDVHVQQVVDLRRVLTNAGYGTVVAEVAAEGAQD